MKKKLFELSIFVLVGLLLAFSFASNPYADFAATDSAVFHYIGSLMHHGFIPYRDVFDHKGPLIYFINYIASFSGSSLIGLWIVELIVAIATFMYICRFAFRFFEKSLCSYAIVIYAAFFAYGNMAGNFTETYAHLFIVIVLLQILENVINKTSFTFSQSFLTGLCFAAILLLRPNMGVIAFVTAIFFITDLLKSYDYKTFLLNSVFVFFGMLCLLLPFIAYFFYNGCLTDLWNCYIVYNLEYASKSFAMVTVYAAIAGFLTLLGLIPLFDREWRYVGVYNLVFLGLTFLVIYANSTYKHYILMIVPGIILPIMCILKRLQSMRGWQILRVFILLGAFAFISKEVLQSNFDIGGYAKQVIRERRISSISAYREGEQDRNMLLDIGRLIHENESVAVIGNDCSVYRILGVISRNYFAYIPDAYNEQLKSRIFSEICAGKNDCAISNRIHIRKAYEELLLSHYEVVATSGDYTLWRFIR